MAGVGVVSWAKKTIPATIVVTVPSNLRTNAFRVLRLSANATNSDVHKAADSMRRAITLGAVATTPVDVPALGDVPRTAAEIQGAIGRLANPAQRLQDRLFWFHSQAGSEAGTQTVDSVIEGHDRALHTLVMAVSTQLDQAGVELWVKALREWHALIQDDDYWAAAMDLEGRGGFEPLPLWSELEALRDGAVRLAAESLAISGRGGVANGDAAVVQAIIGALAQLKDLGPWVEQLEEELLAPTLEQFQALGLAFRRQCSESIRRQKNEAAYNRKACGVALLRYRNEIAPALNGVVRLVPPSHEAFYLARREATRCLDCLASGFTWADDYITAETLLQEALELSHGTVAAVEIAHDLTEIGRSADKQRVWGELEPITSAPSLYTLNGSGFTIYGKSDYDDDTHSYATTHYFVVLFIPIFPIARYRVVARDTDEYSFLGQLPLRKGDRWHLGAMLAAISLIIIAGITSGPSSGSGAGSTDTPPPPVSSQTTAPHQEWLTPPPRATSPPATPPPATPRQATPRQATPRQATPSRADKTELHSSESQMAALRARIDAGGSRLQILDSKIGPVSDKLPPIQKRIEAIEANLRDFDRQIKAEIEVDVDVYNAHVYNRKELLKQYEALLASASDEMAEYLVVLRQTNELVDQYNALVAQYNAPLK